MDAHLDKQRTHPESRTLVMPHDSLGWWGFGLLLAAATNPLYCWALWAATRFVDDPEAKLRALMTLTIAVPAVIVGSAALARRASRSIVLIVLAAIVAIEIAWSVFFVVAFGNGVLGLVIAAAAVVVVFAGVFLARRTVSH